MKTYRTYFSLETKRLGAELAKKLARDKRHVSRRHALILALKGDLGSGKTTFVRGFLRGLGVRGRVNSPTFVILKRFRLHVSGFKNAYHIDCYRLKEAKELLELGLQEILGDLENIVLIEWSERISRFLPKSSKQIGFHHGVEEKVRILTLKKI